MQDERKKAFAAQAQAMAKEAKELCDAGRAEDAWAIAEKLLGTYPHSANPVILASYVAWKMRRYALAYQLGLRGTAIAPQESTAWINLGMAAQEMWMIDEAELCYKSGYRLAKDEPERAMAQMDLAALYVDTGRFKEAETAARASLSHFGGSAKAKANLGFALLGQRRWEGWDFYSHSLGLESRQAMQYMNEPPWDGTHGLTVILYGEQGLGDEMAFASMLPDAIGDCGRVIVDCDRKLEGLFRRSFPQATVYGTRRAKPKDGEKWAQKDWTFDASLALGELGAFYRRTDESFHGTPYLIADPERARMWRGFLEPIRKPRIGIAWTGGIRRTGRQFRTLTLDDLLPVLSAVDAHWVSLQYEDASKEIAAFGAKHPEIDLVQYPWATLTPDYDDTAALVAELDMVICMQTAVAHLAGGLGKDCWVLLPANSQWRYGSEGSTVPWYASLRVFRQTKRGEWGGPIGHVVELLRKRYPASMQEAA
jgi:tetratricopeptide (TPR) repeat protein